MATIKTASYGKRSILFVCLGNICRSPMAEAVFLELIKSRTDKLDWKVDSCATSGWHTGGKPDSRCLQTLKNNGVTDYCHTVRQIKKDDFVNFQYIVCMDQSNLSDLKDVEPSNGVSQVLLLGSFDPANRTGVIRDPYYDSDLKGFENVFKLSKQACENFLENEGFNESL